MVSVPLENNKIIRDIETALDGGPIPTYYISNTDQFIDLMDHFSTKMKITWPAPFITLDGVDINVFITELRSAIARQHTSDEYIEYIERGIAGDTVPNLKIGTNDQLVDILEYFEQKYALKIPVRLLNVYDLNELTKHLGELCKYYTNYKFVIVYAKVFENKQTHETVVEGPYFGEQADSQELIDKKAKELVDKQQNNAVVVRVYERKGRTDQEIMANAKKYFNRVHSL